MIMPPPPSRIAVAETVELTTSELRSAVRRFIGRRLLDPATADDLTQEVFIKVQKHVGKVRDPRRIMGWVIQVARTTVADYFRRARGTEPIRERHQEADAVRPGALDREESRLREDLAAYIRSVVQSLPAPYRDALVLTEFDGLTQVELARRLGLSVSAAKSRVQRARAMVRENLERCCDFELDHYGAVMGCTPRRKRCACGMERESRTTAN